MNLPHTAGKRAAAPGRVQALDAGRGIAALLVVEHHIVSYFGPELAAFFRGSPTIVRALKDVAALNVYAVMFFFFVSGWSIALSMRKLAAGDGRIQWNRYFWHRARRILPFYWIALAWSGALVVLSQSIDADISARTLAGNLLFLQSTGPTAWFRPYADNGPLWSLANEVWYYLALPLGVLASTYLAPRKMRIGEVGLLASFLVGVGAIAANRFDPNPAFEIIALSPIWFAGFVAGRSESEKGRFGRITLMLCAATAALWVSSGILRSSTLLVLLWGYSIATAVCVGVWIAKRSGPLRDLSRLAFAPIIAFFAYLGGGSYTVYVLHYPLVRLIAFEGGRHALLIVICVLAVLVAGAPLFETRVQAWVNSLGRRTAGPVSK